jgi:hypothetical protein
MNYLERYTHGEFEKVWSELLALGPAVREEPVYSQARQVADETMRRVRRNCEKLVARLRTLGYAFGTYPDGSQGYYSSGPLLAPGEETREDIAALEEAAGPLPISLVAFWEQVGSVDLVGMLRSWPPEMDPLVVYFPDAAVSQLDEMEDMIRSSGYFETTLAPDNLHKENISGGDPYAVRLPEPGADFVLRNEKHNLYFVPYLRFAILRFGGFPGLDRGDEEFDALPDLLNGLEPF